MDMKGAEKYRVSLGIGNQEMARYLGVSPSLVSMFYSGERELQGMAFIKLSQLDRMLFGVQLSAIEEASGFILNLADQIEIENRIQFCRVRMESIRKELERIKMNYRQGILMLKLTEAFRHQEPALYHAQTELFLSWEREANYKVMDCGLNHQRMLEIKIELLMREEQAWAAFLVSPDR